MKWLKFTAVATVLFFVSAFVAIKDPSPNLRLEGESIYDLIKLDEISTAFERPSCFKMTAGLSLDYCEKTALVIDMEEGAPVDQIHIELPDEDGLSIKLFKDKELVDQKAQPFLEEVDYMGEYEMTIEYRGPEFVKENERGWMSISLHDGPKFLGDAISVRLDLSSYGAIKKVEGIFLNDHCDRPLFHELKVWNQYLSWD